MTDPLIDVFAGVLETDNSNLNEDSSRDTVDSWGSLSAMHLISAIEQKFSVRFSTREIMKMTSIGLARSTLRGKGIDI
jgi:acyl carrier protein